MTKRFTAALLALLLCLLPVSVLAEGGGAHEDAKQTESENEEGVTPSSDVEGLPLNIIDPDEQEPEAGTPEDGDGEADEADDNPGEATGEDDDLEAAAAAAAIQPAALPPGPTLSDNEIDLSAIYDGESKSDWTVSVGILELYGDGPFTLTGSTGTYTVQVTNTSQAVEITLKNASITSSITHAFDIETGAAVDLWLVGDNTLKTSDEYSAALHAPDGTTLTIGAGSVQDHLTAKNNHSTGYGAGIGGGDREDGGDITIKGGEVQATSIEGAGIGGGAGSAGGAGGDITIEGGEVNAASDMGAGIGGGYGSALGGAGGTITIEGGEVNAKSGRGAGIGGGFGILAGGAGGDITIAGGEVQAESNSGAGIGGGEAISIGGAGGTITIKGGAMVTASSHQYAIGTGQGGTPGTITIDGGSVKLVNGTTNPQPRNTDDEPLSPLQVNSGAVAARLVDDAGTIDAPMHPDDGEHIVYRWLPNAAVSLTLTHPDSGEAWRGTVTAGTDSEVRLPFPVHGDALYDVRVGGDLTITVYPPAADGGGATLTGVALRGTALSDPDDYTLSGSSLTLHGTQLAQLSAGDHALTLTYDNGFASHSALSVQSTPSTGSNSSGSGNGGSNVSSAPAVLAVVPAHQTWNGEAEGLTFTVADASPAALVSVSVDGAVLDAGSYSVREGSVVLRLRADYLETLAVDDHTLRLQFWNGVATATFAVQLADVSGGGQAGTAAAGGNVNDNPSTGGAQSGGGAVLVAMIVAAGGVRIGGARKRS